MQIAIDSPEEGLTLPQLQEAVTVSLMGLNLRRVLLIPPDITRLHSGAGVLTNLYWKALKDTCQVKILPALGTHVPMTRQEQESFFGPEIPGEAYLVHDWRQGVEQVGSVPREEVRRISGGLMDEEIPVELDRAVTDGGFDLILSIGQVVPHEVVGMAGYSKNLLVGCGGSGMINASHFLGAVCGMEQAMGRDHAPARRLFDYAEEHFLLNRYPIVYVLTVTTVRQGEVQVNGLYIGRKRSLFEQAVRLSQRLNLDLVEQPFEQAAVWLDPREFRSTWLGNKAIYRTRMAMADGGTLYILAPGVERFGEDGENDRLIRKYGYRGREQVLRWTREDPELRANRSVAAHLIHGSGEGRFRIVYCTEKLGKDEVEAAGFDWLPLEQAKRLLALDGPADGWRTAADGSRYFSISNPALGLWADKTKMEEA